ncbi:DUF1622 domain-containing protein [Sphingomonas kaistensis]|uniref:DUF1622 domain-containing protein n=1 Tax=Sphingomonas kaistensis TaxID=298708 RepID=A0ABZ2FYZ7_9SPHN
MFESWLIDLVRITTRVVEIAGVAIIVLGAFATLFLFLVRLAKGENRDQATTDFRSSLGRAILLGLEFLVAADIINTVAIEPTLNSLAILAGIVAIRTFLSFSLEAEIDGRWPWQRAASERQPARQARREAATSSE